MFFKPAQRSFGPHLQCATRRPMRLAKSLIPISVLYSLLPRILLRGTQRRPRMTTQGHNLNVRTRKLSPAPSFRADRECGSSGPSTLTLRALSNRSLRALRAASCALLSAFVLLGQRQRANNTLGDNTGPTCSCPFGLVGVGSRPQWRGHDYQVAPLICPACGSALASSQCVRAHQHGSNTRHRTRWCH